MNTHGKGGIKDKKFRHFEGYDDIFSTETYKTSN